MLYNLIFTSLPVVALGGKLSKIVLGAFCDVFSLSF